MIGVSIWALRLSLIVLAAGHAAKTDAREDVARAFFAAAKYQEAIDIYSQLFAQYLHPDYIYNIGRCYQNMGDPDRALQSFREFSRKVEHLDPKMQKELNAHVKEMQALKAERAQLADKLVLADQDEATGPAARNEKSPEQPLPTEVKPGAPKQAAPASPPMKSGKDEPSGAEAADRFLAAMRANPERYWRERALKVDDAKLGKTASLVKGAKPNDPRLTDYQLFLATQYAGKHFTLRLQELESRSGAGQASHKVTTGERRLGPEISQTFTAAAGYYLAALQKKDFAKMGEALLGLAVLLEANNMESRARNVLLQLLRNHPQSSQAELLKNPS